MKLELAVLFLAAFKALIVEANVESSLERDLLAQPAYKYVACPPKADPDDCPVPDYTPCKSGQVECEDDPKDRRLKNPRVEEARRLQLFGGSKPVPKQFEISDKDQNLPYDQPCYDPTRNDLLDSWTKWDAPEDGSVEVTLSFAFHFFGKNYTKLFISDNGFLSFVNTFKDNYQPVSFPSGMSTPIIAPFWADAEIASNGGRGNIYYKDLGDKFAVIWDEVGYFAEGDTVAKSHNSFQVVLSARTDFPDINNICFCYLDMGWTHGDRDGVDGFEPVSTVPRIGQSRAATVGITKGLADPFGTTTYSQIGRFNTSGYVHNGVRVPSGVDWLDFLGSTKILNARTGFCFNSGPNMPPVFKAGPTNGIITIPCGSELEEYKVYFGAPEFDQVLKWEILSEPSFTPPGMVATIDGDGTPDDTVGIRFEYLNPDFARYGGQWFNFTFKVCDNVNPPACAIETVAIQLAKCGSFDCTPEKCTPITDSQCLGDVGPKCTPYLSGEHCDPQYSFPMLISSRYPMIKESLHGTSDVLGAAGWWYHYTDDRAGGYSFTRKNGYSAPPLLCCVTSVDQLLGTLGNPSSSTCFDGTPAWTDPIVIRAEGHHGGTGVFVLPLGLDKTGGPTPELSVGAGTITIAQIRSYLSSLSPAPKKILVEKFIAGSGSGATATLPSEYKFHMFNGKIGSISAFLNPGQPCGCYGEYDETWRCLHKYGCFKSQMPFGLKYDSCTHIDFNGDDDKVRTTTVKGYDFCGSVPPPPPCAFNKMKSIAKKLSALIGVYVRIDMFLTAKNEVYVQEYTFNHLGGTKHCAATLEFDCVDSCFNGRNWFNASTTSEERAQGGPNKPRSPAFPAGYGSLTDADQCTEAMAYPALLATSSCK